MSTLRTTPRWLRYMLNPEVRPVWSANDETALLGAYERVWQRKAILRETYEQWYAQLESQTVPGTIVEVGAGTGNFKRWMNGRRVWTVDILRGRWVDIQADALALPFPDRSLDNIILIDALHHFAKPSAFLGAAGRALRPGGRLILLEPYMSTWGGFLYRYVHHERVDVALGKGTDEAWDGNAAIPRMILEGPSSLRPGLTIESIEYLEFLAYPLTGGFSYRALLPSVVLRLLRGLERARIVRNRMLALRVFAVLTPTSDEANAARGKP